MHRPKPLLSSDSAGLPDTPHHTSRRIDFYREEFVKLQECLQRQRESFPEGVVSDCECALLRVMAGLDELCARHDADHLVGCLLERFGLLARLASWDDPRQVH
jgi:hypothetical protein